MIKPNADITIVRMIEDGPPDMDQIKDVEWQESRDTVMTESGLHAADVVTVFVPKSQKDTVTMQKGDYVVRGIKAYDLQGRELRRALERDRAVTIFSVSDYLDFVPEFLAHIEIGCK